MKKSIITLLFSFIAALSCYAAPPKLACETLFSDKSLRNDNTVVRINKSADNYYRCFEVSNDPALVKLMEEKIEIDEKRAVNAVERYVGNNEYCIILNIPNGQNIINVGFTRYSNSEAKLFVQAPLDAFK